MDESIVLPEPDEGLGAELNQRINERDGEPLDEPVVRGVQCPGRGGLGGRIADERSTACLVWMGDWLAACYERATPPGGQEGWEPVGLRPRTLRDRVARSAGLIQTS
jgi:hypothetical protein